EVGRVGKIAAKRAHDVAVRLAIRVAGAVVGDGRAQLGQRSRRRHTRRAQGDVGQRGRRAHVEVVDTEAAGHCRSQVGDLLRCERLVLPPPTPPGSPARAQGSSLTWTMTLPVLAPVNRRFSAPGAFSSPAMTSSACWILPSTTQLAICSWASGKRDT